MPEKKSTRPVSAAMLVYQAGIANVFAVERINNLTDGRNAARMLQSSFGACENYAAGLAAAGVVVRTAFCNRAGDITNLPWTTKEEDAPFSDRHNPVNEN